MCPSSGLWRGLGLWFPVSLPESTFVRRAQLWRSVSVCSSLHVLTRAHCAQYSSSIPVWLILLILAPAGGRTESPDCVVYLCHMISEEFVFLSFLYIKLFELGVEFAFNNRSAVTHHKVNLLKFSLQSSCSERTDDAFVLLICFCFTHL